MNRRDTFGTAMLVVSLCIVSLSVTACDREVAGQIAVLTGGSLGDAVGFVSTAFLLDVWDAEMPPDDADGHDHAEDDSAEHSHDAQPLHNHEH